MMFFFLIFQICLLKLIICKEIAPFRRLTFLTSPLTHHNFKNWDQNTPSPRLCVREKLIPLNQDNYLLKLNIENVIPTYTNLDRFGGSSDSHGKQFIQLEIRALPSEDLVRFKKRLSNGENHILFNVFNEYDYEVEICVINLTYDASWSLFDLDKFVHWEWTNTNDESKRVDMFNKRVYTLQRLREISQIQYDLVEINKHLTDPALVKLHKMRRDHDENTFTWLLYQLIILLICLVVNFGYIIYYLNCRIPNMKNL